MSLKQRLQRLEAKTKPKVNQEIGVIDVRGKSEAEIAEIEASLPKNKLYILLDF